MKQTSLSDNYICTRCSYEVTLLSVLHLDLMENNFLKGSRATFICAARARCKIIYLGWLPKQAPTTVDIQKVQTNEVLPTQSVY